MCVVVKALTCYFMCSHVSGSLDTTLNSRLKIAFQSIFKLLGGVWSIATVSITAIEARNSPHVLEERETAFSVGLLAVIACCR